MVMSLIRLVFGVVPVTLMAIAFFGFNLWALGIAFAAFFAVLILFAWSVGLLVSGILLRYGLGAENLVWLLMFVVQPLGCVYYLVRKTAFPPISSHSRGSASRRGTGLAPCNLTIISRDWLIL